MKKIYSLLCLMGLSILFCTTAVFAASKATKPMPAPGGISVVPMESLKHPLNYVGTPFLNRPLQNAYLKNQQTYYFVVGVDVNGTPGNYGVTLTFAYAESETNYTPVSAPAGGISLDVSIHYYYNGNWQIGTETITIAAGNSTGSSSNLPLNVAPVLQGISNLYPTAYTYSGSSYPIYIYPLDPIVP